MEKNIKLGEKEILGNNVNLDEEELEKLQQISFSLTQVEKNTKENIISELK